MAWVPAPLAGRAASLASLHDVRESNAAGDFQDAIALLGAVIENVEEALARRVAEIEARIDDGVDA